MGQPADPDCDSSQIEQKLTSVMIHDSLMHRNTETDRKGERRASSRTPSQAEVTIRWHHDLDSTLRYELLDVSEGGICIRSGFPVLEGMMGTVLNLLPRGKVINQSAMVAWIRPVSQGSAYEIGIRYV